MQRPGQRDEQEPPDRPSGEPKTPRALPPLRVPSREADQMAPPQEGLTRPGGLPALKPPLSPPQEAPETPPAAPPTPPDESAAKRSGVRIALWVVVPLVILAAVVAAVLSATSGSSRHGTFLTVGFGRQGTTSLYRTQRVMRGYIKVTSGPQSPFELNMTEMDTLHVDASAGVAAKVTVGTNDWGLFNGQNLQPVTIPAPMVVHADRP